MKKYILEIDHFITCGFFIRDIYFFFKYEFLVGTYQSLVYADDKLVTRNINTTEKIAEALLEAGKEVGLEINAERNCSCRFT
jgi:hypothetical protein